MEDLKPIFQSIYFKIAIGVVVLAIIALIINAILKNHNLSDSYTRESDNEVVSSELSFSSLEYKGMAERLYGAMNGLGTGESIILSVLGSLQTKSDWLKIVAVFGVRESTLWTSSFSGNLIQWFGTELTGDEMREVSDVLAKIGVII